MVYVWLLIKVRPTYLTFVSTGSQEFLYIKYLVLDTEISDIGTFFTIRNKARGGAAVLMKI